MFFTPEQQKILEQLAREAGAASALLENSLPAARFPP